MAGPERHSQRRILGVFAHPDDETSTCGGTFARYAREGVDIHVVTATRGELGELGTGGLKVEREDLPAVREAELRSVLELYGVNLPILLGYRDQELGAADFDDVVQKVTSIMQQLTPDVVITFGPTGVSHHEDHIAISRIATEAFHRYSKSTGTEARLFYVALPEEIANQFELALDESETSISVAVDIGETKSTKLQALRLYRSQHDAQELAGILESGPFNSEWFHQVHPPAERGRISAGFWE